jgi:hypothetical protein
MGISWVTSQFQHGDSKSVCQESSLKTSTAASELTGGRKCGRRAPLMSPIPTQMEKVTKTIAETIFVVMITTSSLQFKHNAQQASVNTFCVNKRGSSVISRNVNALRTCGQL